MDGKTFHLIHLPWKESEKLAGKKGYKHPVRVVYNPKTMTYRTIKSEPEFQVIDKKDIAFYKEAEKTDKSIKVCEIDEKDFYILILMLSQDQQKRNFCRCLQTARKI